MSRLANALHRTLEPELRIQDTERKEVFLMNLKKNSIKKLKLKPNQTFNQKMTDLLKKETIVLAVQNHPLPRRTQNVSSTWTIQHSPTQKSIQIQLGIILLLFRN